MLWFMEPGYAEITPMPDIRSRIAAFLATRLHGVISTVHADGSVESALVAISNAPDDVSITFATLDSTRKFSNIVRDPRVAFVVTDDESIEVQFEGRARVTEGHEREQCKNMHVTKNPRAAKHANVPGQQFISVEPTWIRYTDRTNDPHVSEELRF